MFLKKASQAGRCQPKARERVMVLNARPAVYDVFLAQLRQAMCYARRQLRALEVAAGWEKKYSDTSQ